MTRVLRAMSLLGAASGVIYILLLLAANFLLPPLPDPKAPAAFFNDIAAQHTGTQVGLIVLSVAYLFLLLFMVYLTNLIRRLDPQLATLVNLALLSGFGYLVFEWLSIAVTGTVWLGAASGTEAASFHWAAAAVGVAVVLAFFPLAAFHATIGTAAVLSRGLPAWLAWATVVLAALEFSGAVALLAFRENRLGAISFVLSLLWPLVTGLVLTHRVWRLETPVSTQTSARSAER